MTTSASDALQAGLYAALTGDSALQLAMGGTVRAYDRVPPNPMFPYLYIADAQLLDDGDTCEADRFEAYADVHIWTDAVGVVAGKVIAGAVRHAVMTSLTLAPHGWAAPIVKYESERHLRDGDGMRGHSLVTFKIIIEPA